jgi:HPt (histidine-containing phosphotransfer) domain-containing protein
MKPMTPQAAAETDALIAELWQRHLPTIRERLEILERISGSAAIGPLSKGDRDEGISISHKFAGSLGMYGYRQGTEIASQMEQLFRSGSPIEPEIILSLTYQLREAIFPTI